MESSYIGNSGISILLCALLFQSISCQINVVRPGGNIPQTAVTNGPSNCNYILSAGAGGTCVVTTKDVERRFSLVTDEISRTRLQFVSQNSVWQRQLANLTKTDTTLNLQIDGLKRDLQALKSRVQTPGTSGTSSGTNVNVNQLQSSLTQSINSLDKRLNNFSLQYQRDAVAAAQTDAALQQQLTQVVRDNQRLQSTITILTQDFNSFKNNYAKDLQQLTTQIRAIAAASVPGTAPPATTTTAAPTTPAATSSNVIPASVLQDIKALNATIQKNIQDITTLNNQQAAVQPILTNHTQEIRDIHVELNSLQSVRQQVKNNYNTLQLVNTVTLPGIQSDIRTLQNDVSNVKNMTASLQAGQFSLLNSTVFIKSDILALQNDLTQGQTRQNQAMLKYAQGIYRTLGTSLQIRTQLQTLQQNLQTQLNSNSVINPTIPVPTTPLIVRPPILPGRPG